MSDEQLLFLAVIVSMTIVFVVFLAGLMIALFWIGG